MAKRSFLVLRKKRSFQFLVNRKLRELKKIVPRSPIGTDVDTLLRTTAEYICYLELQVLVLRRLSLICGV
ncbi:hypothetical protein LUZ62_053095 [Rhynchospora pubera]|uniref:BHLH domain-containing protein n=1 Tax=Rhynchospora pubera TaxID=906938 RepID=A0AAV8GCC0_9POAL|nr:hypothetical protein LUZ62_053095 [Rhynchospora pubera]